MFDVHNVILPTVNYLGRRRLTEGEDAWKARVIEVRYTGNHSSVIAAQVQYGGVIHGAAVCVRAMPDFCAGVLVHSGRTYQSEPDDVVGKHPAIPTEAEAEMALTVVPDIDEICGSKQNLGDVNDLLRRSVAHGVVTYAYRTQRPILMWADKEDGPLTKIMDNMALTMWCWESLINPPSACIDWDSPRPLMIGTKCDQINCEVDVVEGMGGLNPKSGNNVRTHTATVAWPELKMWEDKPADSKVYRIKRSPYPVKALRDRRWWLTVPTSEFRNG